jgi:hypothetical protein
MNTDSTTGATPDTLKLDDLYTLEALVAASPNGALSITNLRWQLRHRHETGLDACVVSNGKQLLISKSRYERWLVTRIERSIRTNGAAA